MAGITTALVVFILLGVAIPALIKNRTQFYVAVAFTGLSILALPFAFVATFFGFLTAIFQLLAFIGLVLCAGGLELSELAGHMGDAYTAMRHGDQSKPIIVPRTPNIKTTETAAVNPTIVPPPPPPPPVLDSIPMEPGPKDKSAPPSE